MGRVLRLNKKGRKEKVKKITRADQMILERMLKDYYINRIIETLINIRDDINN